MKDYNGDVVAVVVYKNERSEHFLEWRLSDGVGFVKWDFIARTKRVDESNSMESSRRKAKEEGREIKNENLMIRVEQIKQT